MATKKPRLTITLDPDLSESLRRLSELTGNSQSSLISEMLSGSGPVLEKMITVLEAAQVAKDAIKGRITRGLDDAQGKFEQALGLAFDGFDDIDAALKQMAEAAPERQTPTASASAAAADFSAQPTPLSNRGVRSTTTPRKSTKKTITSDDLLWKSEQAEKQAKKPIKKSLKKVPV